MIEWLSCAAIGADVAARHDYNAERERNHVEDICNHARVAVGLRSVATTREEVTYYAFAHLLQQDLRTNEKPSSAFANAFSKAVGAVTMQLARKPAFASRLSSAATAFAVSAALALTAAPQDASAQNQVKRGALDLIAGLAGAALGHQIGGGQGKQVATAAGAAAGVWVAEEMQGRSNGNGNSYGTRSPSNVSNSNLGPSNDWGTVQVPGERARVQPTRTTYVTGPERGAETTRYSNASVPGMSSSTNGGNTLMSGTTTLSAERVTKLAGMERSFLQGRDKYARALFNEQQAQDDAVLSPGDKDVMQQVAKAGAESRTAMTQYEHERKIFVDAVEHMGERGYDVHQFAYSHSLAGARVTANDMNRGDLGRVSHRPDVRMDNSVREEYTPR